MNAANARQSLVSLQGANAAMASASADSGALNFVPSSTLIKVRNILRNVAFVRRRMMRRMESTVTIRMTATAIALTAGTFLVAAHAQPGGTPGGSPSAQPPAGAQQQAPEPKTGQQPKTSPQPKTADPKAQNGAPPKGTAQPKENGTPPKSTAQPKDDGAPPKSAQPKDKAAPRADDKAAPKAGAKTGEQKSGQTVNITTQQRTEIRQTIIKSGNAPF